MSKSRKKKNMLTFLLLISSVIILLVAYLLLLDRNKKKEEADADKEEDTSIMLTSINEEDVSEVRVLNASYEFTVKKEGDVWLLKGEEAFPLNQTVAENLISKICSLNAIKLVLDEAEDLSEYGLSTPGITVTIVQKDGTKQTLNLGDTLATESNYYASMNDENAVYVVSSSIYSAYDKSRSDLMEVEDVPTISSDLITGLKISSNQYDSFTLLNDENSKLDYSGGGLYPWYIKEYYSNDVNADTEAVNELLSNYTSISMSSGVDYRKENLSDYGLDNPETALSIWYLEEEGGEEKELTLFFGKQDEEGNYYVRMENSDRTYLMSASKVETLCKVDVFGLTSKMTNLINIDSITGFDIQYGTNQHSYTIKTEEETSVFYVDGVEYDEDAAFRAFYQKVIGLTVDGIMTETIDESTKPVVEITFHLKNDVASKYGDMIRDGEFHVEYLPYDEEHYAVRVNNNEIFVILKEKIAQLMDAVEAL